MPAPGKTAGVLDDRIKAASVTYAPLQFSP
jgi:hypothetical protein